MSDLREQLSAAWSQLENAGTPWGSLLVSGADELKRFVSLSGSLRRCLMVQHSKKFPVFPEFDAVNISQSQNTSGQWFLVFELLEPSHGDEFSQLCSDMLENASGEQDHEKAVQLMLNAYTEWLDFYKSSTRLTTEVCRGLFGELKFLQVEVIPNFGNAQAIESWVGPLGAPQDFVFPSRLSCEIKTVQPNGSSVKISSLQQLASKFPLVLSVVRVSNSFTEGLGQSISTLVDEIEQTLDPAELMQFRRRLRNLRIDWQDSKLESLNFVLQSFEHFYASSDGFPKITPEQVGSGIRSVKYEINLPELDSHRLDTPWEF